MTLAADIPLDLQQHFVLEDASWEFYERLLEEVGNRPIRVTYCDGRMEIMSPLPKHESWAYRIGALINVLCIERNISMVPTGSTTFRSIAKQKGLEPNNSFYFEHWKAAQEMEGPFDPTVHPPPDLAIEVDITRRSIPKEPIYAALRVPELWRFDGKRLYISTLASSGSYEEKAYSTVFPFLPISDFERFIDRFRKENDTVVMRAFQEWVRTLKA